MTKEKKHPKTKKPNKERQWSTLHRNLNNLQPESHRGRRFANQRHYRELNGKLS